MNPVSHIPFGDPGEKLLTFAEAAKLLSISLRQFRRLIDGGSIAFVQVSPRAPRVRTSIIQDFITSATVQRPKQVAA
jgi:excisionase family DNA binding protein